MATKRNKKKVHNIIFTTDYNVEDYQDDFNEWCEDNGLDPEEEDIYDYINESISGWADDERDNLDIECGNILAIADLGLWDGRRSAYKIIKSGKVNGILDMNLESGEFYSDGKNIRCTQHHHDGTNYITFREIKPTATDKGIERICDMLYNGEEVPQTLLNRYTRSLCPAVNKVYGWK